MSEQPTVQPQSNVLGILSIVFAILGIFFLGIVFVPLAFLCAIAATYQAVKKASLARNSDISVDPYDRRAHDLAHATSNNRHLSFVAANTCAAWRNFNYLMDGAQASARRVLKRKFMSGISRFAMDFALRVLRAVYVSRHGIFRTALRKILRRALLDFDFRVLAEILSPKQNRRNFIKSFIDEILQSSRTCK